ncbi:uncharacterized protein LOC143200984 isoform X3 [Rhynchophorus ferrugineus]|uniref:uncharacterized protein LOC143200984 isoform X3 n=1 Tax=Rhynchophorus ferrugineus TaxID=354439 RepID=UPI003FCD655D
MSTMGTQTVVTEAEFNALQFEKTLTNLKDSQESINSCCQWCLKNRQHHKKIVNSWLNVLKRVKVEQRLILFYLANDVVQYSKRRNYEYVESWGTAIQKATTLVRDDKVKHKILRIFKIWEQRSVYGEEFITDLCGLISVQPAGPKNDEPHEFQASYVINKIKTCANLEKDTDLKLKQLKEHNPKIQIIEGLINSLKDRVHVDDVEKELDEYVDHVESYINALKLEIKNRIALISILRQAENQLDADRKDVKLVAHAYKTFGQRVKIFQKKLDEHITNMPSPIPSPDINAPSPSPDSELELPNPPTPSRSSIADTSLDLGATIQFTNPGYYNPVPPPSLNDNTVNSSASDSNLTFLSNGFTSFLGQDLSFDIANISASGLFSSSMMENSSMNNTTQTTSSYGSNGGSTTQSSLPVDSPQISNNDLNTVYNPLLPPPMPPFSKNEDGNFSFSTTMESTNNYAGSYQSPVTYSVTSYNPDTVTNTTANYDYQVQASVNSYDPSSRYDTTDSSNRWENMETPLWNDVKEPDTPESPPLFEKKAYRNPVEYHDGAVPTGAADVDHRVLPGLGDLESISGLGSKDIDHRNLISLTGSPNVDSGQLNGSPVVPLPERGNLKTITPQDTLWDTADHDYRKLSGPKKTQKRPDPPLPSSNDKDRDYRIQYGLDNLNVPPPPPPPKSPEGKRGGDIVENVDMDLSDDLDTPGVGEAEDHLSLEPPPPPPNLLDDVDANQFLDEISSDLKEFENLSSELNGEAMSNPNMETGQEPSDMQPIPPWPQSPMTMGYNMGPPPNNMMTGMGRIDMSNPPPSVLPSPMMNAPPQPWMESPAQTWQAQGTVPLYDEGQQYGGDPNFGVYRPPRVNFRSYDNKIETFGFRARGRGPRGNGPNRGRGGARFFRSRGNPIILLSFSNKWHHEQVRLA